MIRPHLEFTNQIWHPYLKKDITMVENVQRRATKMINGMKGKNYEERLRELDLLTLRYKKSRGDMIETYKIITGKYDNDVSIGMFPITDEKNLRGHTMKIYKEHVNKDLRKYSFCMRVVNNWNNLLGYVINSRNVIEFQNNLDYYWRNQKQKLDYSENISLKVTKI